MLEHVHHSGRAAVNAQCAYSWTILKAIDDVASGTMSLVSIAKTRRCSGIGEIIADMLAKGCIENLSQTDHNLLQEISLNMDVVIPTTCLEAIEINSGTDQQH